MKKTYDWSVRIWITVSNNQRKLQIVTSIHTNIHQLKIQIAKTLQLPILDTHIQLYHRDSRPLKAISTLQQNQIDNNAHLTATITRTKENAKLVEGGTSTQKKEKVGNAGLSIVSSCTNPSCVNYNEKVQIHYGFGDFDILALTSFGKCQVCPYKSQFLRPNMMCHSIKVQRCFYKLSGTALNSCNIPVPHQTANFKTNREKEVHKLLEDNPWHIGMKLRVREI